MLLIWLATFAWATGGTAHARSLHYHSATGEQSIELTTEQKTFPALHVKLSEDETVYGALYDVTEAPAPANSLHIEHDNTEYWVGVWCDWWPHLVNGHADCGPTLKLTNKFLTLAEVNKYITPTDISQWELISACSDQYANCGGKIPNPNPTGSCECAAGTLQPGIYLFFNHYANYAQNNAYGHITRIAIFDHTVSYKSTHAAGIYQTSIDTQHEEYESPNLSNSGHTNTSVNTNISGLPDEMNLYIYRLK